MTGIIKTFKKFKVLHFVILALGIFVLVSRSNNSQAKITDTFPSVQSKQERMEISLDLIGELQSLNHDYVYPKIWNGRIAYLRPEGFVKEGEVVLTFETKGIEDELKQSQEQLESAIYALENLKESIELQRVQSDNNLEMAQKNLENAETNYQRRKTEIEEGIRPAIDLAQSEISLLQAQQSLEESELSLKTRENQWELDLIDKQKTIDYRKEKVEEKTEDLANGTIYAHKDGLMIHNEGWFGQVRKYQEGDETRKDRPILDFPAITDFIVRVKINERDLYKVKVGQTALITIDAVPGKIFEGKLNKIADIASSDMGTSSITFSAQGESKGFAAEILLSKPEEDIEVKNQEKNDSLQIREARRSQNSEMPDFVKERIQEEGMTQEDFQKRMNSWGEAEEPSKENEENDDFSNLRPGMTSLTRIILEVIEGAIILPRSAIFIDEGQTVVYRVVNNSWEKVIVNLGAVTPQEAQIKSGVSNGETFLIVAPEEGAISTAIESAKKEDSSGFSGGMPQGSWGGGGKGGGRGGK